MVTHEERQRLAESLARPRGWNGEAIRTSRFNLTAYFPPVVIPTESVAIYIEGDGQAWANLSRPSSDPTPRNPIGLRLALAHPNGHAAYLARPCQYAGVGDSECNDKYWTSGRFSPQVIAATDAAVDRIKDRFKAHHVTLIGFSGGGAVAALIAERRSDVDLLVTVVAPLDHSAWSSLHQISPLDESLNPIDVSAQLANTPQIHFAGAQDKNIPPSIAYRFVSASSANDLSRVHVEDRFDHQCCWAEEWPRLWHIARRGL